MFRCVIAEAAKDRCGSHPAKDDPGKDVRAFGVGIISLSGRRARNAGRLIIARSRRCASFSGTSSGCNHYPIDAGARPQGEKHMARPRKFLLAVILAAAAATPG